MSAQYRENYAKIDWHDRIERFELKQAANTPRLNFRDWIEARVVKKGKPHDLPNS